MLVSVPWRGFSEICGLQGLTIFSTLYTGSLPKTVDVVDDDDDADHLVRVDENVDGRGDAEEEVAELDHLI